MLPNANATPRSYDLALLYSIRALNVAWTFHPSREAKETLSQWLIHTLAYFHRVPDEGANRKHTVTTDVLTQLPAVVPDRSVLPRQSMASAAPTGHFFTPFSERNAPPRRSLSTQQNQQQQTTQHQHHHNATAHQTTDSLSPSPQRRSTSGTLPASISVAATAVVDSDEVDFAALPLGGATSVPRSSTYATATSQTPKTGGRHYSRPPPLAAATSIRRGTVPPPQHFVDPTACTPSAVSDGGCSPGLPSPAPAQARHPHHTSASADPTSHLEDLTQDEALDHPLFNAGYKLILDLLEKALDVDVSLCVTLMKCFLEVLPESTVSHAELLVAMFEVFPFTEDQPSNDFFAQQMTHAQQQQHALHRRTSPLPQQDSMLEQDALNASGSLAKSFLLFFRIAVYSASFERQCFLLTMSQTWREWIDMLLRFHQQQLLHVCPAAAGSGREEEPQLQQQGREQSVAQSESDYFLRRQQQPLSSHERPLNEAAAAESLREALRVGSHVDDDAWSLLVGDYHLSDAIGHKDVSAVLNKVHRYFQRRLGADGSGHLLMEMMVNPSATMPTAKPTADSPAAFLFGVEAQAGGLPQGISTQPFGAAEKANHSFSLTSQRTVHVAITCTTLTLCHFYLSLRATQAALRCAKMAILNVHDSGVTDGLALAHLLRSRSYMTAGDINSASEDAAIALSISLADSAHADPQVRNVGCESLTSALVFAVELLTHYPGAVGSTLREALMRASPSLLGSEGDVNGGGANGTAGGATADGSAGATGHGGGFTRPAVEVAQSIAQTVRHALLRSEWAAMEYSASASFAVISRLMRETAMLAAAIYGVFPALSLLDAARFDRMLAVFTEDVHVAPTSTTVSSSATFIVELGRQAIFFVCQHVGRAYSAPGATAAVLHPYRLLQLVHHRLQSTELLQRGLHFSLSVELAVASALWERGYAVAAMRKLEWMLSTLHPIKRRHHNMTSLPNPLLYPNQEDHWPPESLLLFTEATRLLAEVYLANDMRVDAEGTRRDLESLSRRCGYSHGVCVARLIEAKVHLANRNRPACEAIAAELCTMADTHSGLSHLPVVAEATLLRLSSVLLVPQAHHHQGPSPTSSSSDEDAARCDWLFEEGERVFRLLPARHLLRIQFQMLQSCWLATKWSSFTLATVAQPEGCRTSPKEARRMASRAASLLQSVLVDCDLLRRDVRLPLRSEYVLLQGVRKTWSLLLRPTQKQQSSSWSTHHDASLSTMMRKGIHNDSNTRQRLEERLRIVSELLLQRRRDELVLVVNQNNNSSPSGTSHSNSMEQRTSQEETPLLQMCELALLMIQKDVPQ